MGNELTEDNNIQFKVKQVQNARDKELYKKKILKNQQTLKYTKYREKQNDWSSACSLEKLCYTAKLSVPNLKHGQYITLKRNFNINNVSSEEEEETRLQFYGMFVFLYFTIYADPC